MTEEEGMSESPNSEISCQLDETEIQLGLVGWKIDWADQEGFRLTNKRLGIAIVLSENEVGIFKIVESGKVQ